MFLNHRQPFRVCKRTYRRQIGGDRRRVSWQTLRGSDPGPGDRPEAMLATRARRVLPGASPHHHAHFEPLRRIGGRDSRRARHRRRSLPLRVILAMTSSLRFTPAA